MISVSIDMGVIPEGLRQMLDEDLPFTIARFLTMSAQTGQEAAREKERTLFKLRNDWTTRNTKITPAVKGRPFSEVFTDTANRSTGAPDYMPRQDEGGEKVPFAGRHFLAIPTRYLRKMAPGVIPKSLRPTSLLPPGATFGQQYKGRFGAVGKSATPYPRTRRQHDALAQKEFVAFVQKTKTGALCIFVRHGGVTWHAGTHDAEPWYVLVTSAHIKGRFPMEQIVEAAVEAAKDVNFDRAAAEVLINNALKSGLQVRF